MYTYKSKTCCPLSGFFWAEIQWIGGDYNYKKRPLRPVHVHLKLENLLFSQAYVIFREENINRLALSIFQKRPLRAQCSVFFREENLNRLVKAVHGAITFL